MKLSETIALFHRLLAQCGDVDLLFDCPVCGEPVEPNHLVIAARFVDAPEGRDRACRPSGGKQS